MEDALVESQKAEAINAIAVAKEAEQKVSQLMQDNLIKALQHALTYKGGDRPALVARIPVICNDIRWIKWAIYGILGGVGAIFSAIVIAIIIKAV